MSSTKPAISIFYDLETSDQNTVGQILNYAFIAVDENFGTVAECAGDVRINRLQLPRAGAILANRVNVLEHQQSCKVTEIEAMIHIRDFVNEMINRSGEPVPLVGYNSDRFDLRYLRTSFIRNGINPYFMGKIQPKDLLIVSRKLLVSNNEFPRLASKDAPEKLSLRLETLTQHFGLLEGAQTHTSLDDVRITIDLARLFAEKFKVDVRNYEGYEVDDDIKPGTLVARLTPEYDLTTDSRAAETPYLFLSGDYRASLWVDLNSFAEGEGRKSIRNRRKKCGELFYEHTPVSAEVRKLVDQAMIELKGITTKNFFSKTLCDVEQDIYQVDFDQMDYLFAAIHKGKDAAVKNAKQKECKVLYTRYKLANLTPDTDDTGFWKMFQKYCLYRYGGKMRLSMGETDEVEYFPTVVDLLQEIESAREGGDAGDLVLLDALQQFYQESDVLKVAGPELGVYTEETQLSA